MARAAVQLAQRFEYLVNGDGCLKAGRCPQRGTEAIADASDAQDARMARFSETESEVFASTSRGRSKTVPGCSSALKSKTLSSKAVVGRMVSSIR
jgi:hypothetical protein